MQIHEVQQASPPAIIATEGDHLQSVPAAGARHTLWRQIAGGFLLLAIGTVLGAMLASIPLRSRIPGGGPGAWRDLLTLPGIGSLTWYACILTSPVYFWLARRSPIDRRNWRRGLLVHFVITTVFVLLTGILFFALIRRPASSPPPSPAQRAERAAPETGEAARSGRRPAEPTARELGFFLLTRLLTESWQFWLMIALIHAYEFHRRDRERELESARLQARLARSRLEALTAQLHPHFLFNTLQAISTLMHRDVKAADAMLSGLSELLRQTLQRGGRQEVPLAEELAVLSHYVDICCERFKNRLIFNTAVTEEAAGALVPFFILQPLVENALEHGIARRAGAGRIQVSAERQGETLHLSVTDDGPGIGRPGMGAPDFPAEGIGLSNTRQRLRQLYGERQSLVLESPAAGGLRVALTIPYRTAEAAV